MLGDWKNKNPDEEQRLAQLKKQTKHIFPHTEDSKRSMKDLGQRYFQLKQDAEHVRSAYFLMRDEQKPMVKKHQVLQDHVEKINLIQRVLYMDISTTSRQPNSIQHQPHGKRKSVDDLSLPNQNQNTQSQSNNAGGWFTQQPWQKAQAQISQFNKSIKIESPSKYKNSLAFKKKQTVVNEPDPLQSARPQKTPYVPVDYSRLVHKLPQVTTTTLVYSKPIKEAIKERQKEIFERNPKEKENKTTIKIDKKLDKDEEELKSSRPYMDISKQNSMTSSTSRFNEKKRHSVQDLAMARESKLPLLSFQSSEDFGGKQHIRSRSLALPDPSNKLSSNININSDKTKQNYIQKINKLIPLEGPTLVEQKAYDYIVASRANLKVSRQEAATNRFNISDTPKAKKHKPIDEMLEKDPVWLVNKDKEILKNLSVPDQARALILRSKALDKHTNESKRAIELGPNINENHLRRQLSSTLLTNHMDRIENESKRRKKRPVQQKLE